jgi:hypothetical protein
MLASDDKKQEKRAVRYGPGMLEVIVLFGSRWAGLSS